jgi:phosphoribosylformylglycinamidine synthase II
MARFDNVSETQREELTMPVHEIRVITEASYDPAGEAVRNQARLRLGIAAIDEVRVAKVYRVEGVSPDEAARLAATLLCEELHQRCAVDGPIFLQPDALVEIAYKPGMMNPEAASIIRAAADLGIAVEAADSSLEYAFYGEIDGCDVARIISGVPLMNPTVQHVVTEPPESLRLGSFTRPGTESIRLAGLAGDDLVALSKELQLNLALVDMEEIRDHFASIGRDPTVAELKTLAQTWSEHCKHTTFRSPLIIDGVKKPSMMSRLVEMSREFFGELVLSAFHDNSGVIRFCPGYALCGKVETHNAPSAIEPYGGAATGSGGVFRDIAGTGLGAKVILSTDMFCLAPPDLSESELPAGCLHPRYLLQRVVAGVGDYGNRMGIPTANGSVHFHRDFRAKPAVIVGAYGIMRDTDYRKGEPQPGDIVFAVGGRTGLDGIHGATFSSVEMTAETAVTASSAVQIGNAIEEKRMFDALLECGDLQLIRAITDCGAGGFSSAIGEIAEKTGVRIRLERAPLKYPGLAPWQVWLSESQERMVVIVPEDKQELFLHVCTSWNVEATAIGECTGDRRLVVTYDDEPVVDLSMAFLHDGQPERVLIGTAPRPPSSGESLGTPSDWHAACLAVMAHLDVCSKRPIVRKYDHGVQGSMVLAPFTGALRDGPGDAAVLAPLPGRPEGVVVSHGMNPGLMRIDPYRGAIWSVVEAFANHVAVGGDHTRLALIDNFLWPRLSGPAAIGSIDSALDGMLFAARAFKRPFASGKDSLSMSFTGKDGERIDCPPVLSISTYGAIDDAERTVGSDFLRAGSKIVMIGRADWFADGGSVYRQVCGVDGGRVPSPDLIELPKAFARVHQLIGSGDILACHDVSQGGIFATVAEMCIGGKVGAEIRLPGWSLLFNETAGCLIAEFAADADVDALLGPLVHMELGRVQCEPFIELFSEQECVVLLSIDELQASWERPMQEVFQP